MFSDQPFSMDNSVRIHFQRLPRFLSILSVHSLLFCSFPAVAHGYIVASEMQDFDPPLMLPASSSAIFNVIRWTGMMPGAAGRVVRARFSLFQGKSEASPSGARSNPSM
jgi:hypothetical protein